MILKMQKILVKCLQFFFSWPVKQYQTLINKNIKKNFPIWNLETALLNNSCQEMKMEIISALELNDSENIEYQ